MYTSVKLQLQSISHQCVTEAQQINMEYIHVSQSFLLPSRHFMLKLSMLTIEIHSEATITNALTLKTR